MSLCGKFVSELNINAPAEKYYKLFKDLCYRAPNISPNIIQQIEVLEANWDSPGHGCIKIAKYTIEGRDELLKERVEFDDAKLTVIMIGLEGDVFNYYKTIKGIYQVVPKGPEHSLVVFTLEYEKLDDDSPYLYKYLEMMNKITDDIKSHIK